MQLLGCFLGIEDWARTFQERESLPEECVQQPERLETAGFTEIIEVEFTNTFVSVLEVER